MVSTCSHPTATLGQADMLVSCLHKFNIMVSGLHKLHTNHINGNMSGNPNIEVSLKKLYIL